MNTILYPHSLVRYASMDYRQFNSWRFEQADQLTRAAAAYEQTLALAKDRLCHALFDQINQQPEQSRGRLIELKRQVFNGKKMDADRIGKVLPLLNHAAATLLQQYLDAVVAYGQWKASQAQQYENLLLLHRQQLQSLAGIELLQKGLLLSSPVLYEQLSAYQNTPPEQFRQKAFKIEFSLLRYVTRMSYKTSPFSTFTYTGVMVPGNTTVTLPDAKIKSNLRLNNILFGYLAGVFRHHPFINDHLWVKLNGTAMERNGKIHFLVNYNNIESFQQLPASGMARLLLRLLADGSAGIRLGQLVHVLASQVEGASCQEIKAYLQQMVGTGLLETSTGISAMDPAWAEQLLAFFCALDPGIEGVGVVCNLLQHLQQCRLQYAAETAARRYLLLKTATDEVNGALAQLQQQAGLPLAADRDSNTNTVSGSMPLHMLHFVHHRFTPVQLFYEDCYTPEVEVLEAQPVEAFIEKTEQLLQHLAPLDLLKTERENMRDFFLLRYNAGDQVPVTDFYRDYYGEVKMPEKKRQLAGEPRREAYGEWTQWLIKQLETWLAPHMPEIVVLPEWFNGTPVADLPVQQSRGLFVQFFPAPAAPQQTLQRLCGVVNAFLPGMGKVSGRFLSLFDARPGQELKAFNHRLYPEVLKAELCDGSVFNANLHPPLLDHQIYLPGGNSQFSERQRLLVRHLSISYNAATHALELRAGNTRVYAFDLCLESFYNRSHFYQLLSHFNEEVRPSVPAFVKILDEVYERLHPLATQEVYCWPRISYQQSVVIRRKTWQVKTSAVPVPLTGETGLEYLTRLNTWRQHHHLPAAFFLYLRRKFKRLQKSDRPAGTDDDYKPQFIHLHQPLLLELWKKLLSRAGDNLFLEEVLPDPAVQNSITGNAVKEYLLQWYKYSTP